MSSHWADYKRRQSDPTYQRALADGCEECGLSTTACQATWAHTKESCCELCTH